MYENIKVATYAPGARYPAMIQRWHPMRTAMLLRLAPVMGRKRLAKYLGISLRSLLCKAARFGVVLRHDRAKHYTLSELRFMRESSRTLSYQQIADVLGRSMEAVRVAMTVRGWAKGVPTGERHPFCKYPDNDVELCRALYDDGMAIPLIAEKMEVPYPTVRSWVQFESRKTTGGTTHG